MTKCLTRADHESLMMEDPPLLPGGDLTRAAQVLAAQLDSELMVTDQQTFDALESSLSANSVVRRHEPLARRTTLRVGGPADCYVEPATEEDLARVVRFCSHHRIPITLLGRGSNLLIRDGGIRGVVLCLAHPAFSRVEFQDNLVTCGAGARLKIVATEARRHGLAGLEFLEGIPGSIGGALRMNAGAMGSSMFEVVTRMRYMDLSGDIHERAAGDIPVAYRNCPLLKTHLALSAVLRGTLAPAESVARTMSDYSKKRWASQPAAPSAGCIFKNPASLPAGKLIDELGLKGLRVGGAVVSDVHGNFMVNDGNATARDMLQLIQLIREKVKSERGIDLQTEVQIIGEDTP